MPKITAITGTIMDVWQAALEDVGPAGVDNGKGGKYLILPPGYKDAIPDEEVFDSTIPYDMRFFRSLGRVVQYEPWLPRDKAMIVFSDKSMSPQISLARSTSRPPVK